MNGARTACWTDFSGAKLVLFWLDDGQAFDLGEMFPIEGGDLAAAFHSCCGHNDIIVTGHLAGGFESSPYTSMLAGGLLRVWNYW